MQAVLLICLFAMGSAYPHGPPVGLAPHMCAMMAPDPEPKAHNATPQTDGAPYIVSTSAESGYEPGKTYTVVISKVSSETLDFKGFFCQVRRAFHSNMDALGSFDTFLNATKAKYQDCTSARGAFSHAQPDPVPSFWATWIAPNDTDVGNLAVFCTIVQSRQVYWLHVPSKEFGPKSQMIASNNNAEVKEPNQHPARERGFNTGHGSDMMDQNRMVKQGNNSPRQGPRQQKMKQPT
eukprot:m.306500 g.306500  ORF g.306500 m.306500 type:complete len:236 (+) comp41306_c0_seq1:64-771(+)